MGKREPEQLGEAELQVLTALWDAGPMTVREVMNRLHDRGRQVAYTTVLTFLTRLEQKGFVASNKSGVAYVYRAKVSREKVTNSRLSTLIEQLFDGAPSSLVLTLMQNEDFSSEELAAFRTLIDRLDEPGEGH